MNTLRNSKMKETKGLLTTKEKVRETREELERNTEKAFELFRQAKAMAWLLARNKVLD